MGKALVAACLLFASACEGMYDKKADTMHNPPTRARPKVVVVDEEPVFVDACTVDFSAPPTTKRNTQTSVVLTTTGNTTAPGTDRPTTASGVHAVQGALDKYRDALVKDPYNAEATLKLALAYDRLLRKGCALAMLRRLDSLAQNPAFHAVPVVDLVVQNPHWFKPYHPDALKAVGR